ncbi:MAG: hypothetical protein LE178_04810, partial [Endomicrobium sp.]|nr:hypothetical protein [Endomicrobium sp.]
MSSFDDRTPSNTKPIEYVEEFLAKKLSREQKEVSDFLKDFNSDAYDLYRAGIYHFINKDLPSRNLILACCFFELTNVFIERDEEEYKKQFRTALESIEFGKQGEKRDEIIDWIVKNGTVWREIEKLENQRYRLQCFAKQFRPKIKEDELNLMINNVKKARNDFHDRRHWNKTKSSTVDYDNSIGHIEKFILALKNKPYVEQKEILDDILPKINESPCQKPTEGEIKRVTDNLKGNLKRYFFSKLENFEWTQPLKEKNLLYFSRATGEWDALPYLIKAVPEKPDEVLDIIEPFLADLSKDNNINVRILLQVFEIGMAMAKNKKENLRKISEAFLSWLKRKDSVVDDWFDRKVVLKLLQTLTDIGYEYEKIALNIFSELLRLRIEVKENDFSFDGFDGKDFIIVTKFGANDSIAEHYYKEILNNGSEIFKNDPKELFRRYFNITKNLLTDSPLMDKENTTRINYQRRAIEDHQQNDYSKDEPFNIILSALRDASENLLKTNEKNNINFIFSALEEMKSPIFIRLILHLLRLFPSADKKRVESYLTEKNYFNNGEIYHEYYLLRQQEFKNLPDEKQNIIFNFNDLPENMKEKYKGILIQNGKEQHYVEHPDFLDYYESSWGTVSPIEDSVMKNMPIDEVVKYLQDWRPSDKQSLREPTVIGLAQSLEKDVKQNPQKYLDNNNLLRFREITKPVYIGYLFSALSDVDKSVSQWENIIELGLWALKQQLPKDRKRDFFEGYNDWNDTYIDMLRLFKRIYDKELQLKDETAQKLFGIISDLVFVPDEYLSSRETRDDDDYYGNAVNSLHGVAVQSLVEYSLWQKRQKKDIEYIIEILNKLLNTSKYMETWAVLGRFLPWIDMMFPDWTEKNIDKILPENDRSKFDAAWITYIKCVDGNMMFVMFVLLESKFEYVLRNKPYKQEVRNTGEHIAVYYAT